MKKRFNFENKKWIEFEKQYKGMPLAKLLEEWDVVTKKLLNLLKKEE